MMAWGYRKQNLLKELVAYQADILCLQEVCLPPPPLLGAEIALLIPLGDCWTLLVLLPLFVQ